MPEGPEINYMVYNLQKHFKNAVLKEVKIEGGRYKKYRKITNQDLFFKNLPSKFTEFNSKGKFIHLHLENGWMIFISPALTAHIVFEKTKFSHITFKTSKGDFYLEDRSSMGTVAFHKEPKELHKKLKSLGLKPEDKFTFEDFNEHLDKFIKRTPDKPIGEVLMNQRFVAGIGNYLRAEILYNAKLSPWREIKDLSNNNKKTLYNSILNVYDFFVKERLRKSYKSGDSIKVYKKDKDPLGNKVLGDKMATRTVWWVPDIQK
jgi:formamidopyrimidine-DNA glycosylase